MKDHRMKRRAPRPRTAELGKELREFVTRLAAEDIYDGLPPRHPNETVLALRQILDEEYQKAYAAVLHLQRQRKEGASCRS